LNFEEYQAQAKRTAVYPGAYVLTYPALGLAGEAGEFANKVKKLLRDGAQLTTRQALLDELGDVLWYVAICASDLGANLNDIALNNIQKLKDREERGALGGSGDNR
jgi:NTP pyrophosphatase (non-canonical NTP hydrolase)